MVAYFVRGGCDRWAVIRLLENDQEEVVQEGMTRIEAEVLCAMLIEDLPRGAAAVDPARPVEEIAPRRRARQLSLKF